MIDTMWALSAVEEVARLEAEVKRLEDLILAADEYEGLMPMIEPEAAAIRERRK